MKYLKRYKSFSENASGSGTAGSGDVSNALVGNLAGVGTISGSGDISFYFKKQKRKKGNPSQVTDMRDLAPAKGVTKLEEIKESEMVIRPRDPKYDPNTRNMINDCLIELYDDNFELGLMGYDKERHSMDLDDEETGYFSQEELRISLNKTINEYWTGNMIVNCKFDESGVISEDISTLRARGKELTESEQELYVLVEEVAQKLLGNLDYEKGSFRISWEVAGWPVTRQNTSVNVHFNLENNLKE